MNKGNKNGENIDLILKKIVLESNSKNITFIKFKHKMNNKN